ncbi:hypothetical protein ABL78_5380 [Leptomonas seymouri]|uniref:Uncharacterized protein n=1 Tax=Leptomonas seymouri TaxID=5684 RepID=A0A0N1I3L3_LEPSE|nr:hypothetical protein ABL78_5380 [Leptomonas seymouri]|eukprot:KPI85573.1 hypothetical protein ABL78_5380 [Leptomonas seymouri]
MSAVTSNPSEFANSVSQCIVCARSYYSLAKNHGPATNTLSSASQLPEVPGVAGTATLLSRPPSTQLLHPLPELSEDLHVPVPVSHALLALPFSRSISKVENSDTTLNMPSPNSLFRPIKTMTSSRSPRASVAHEEKVKPMLCSPMKPTCAIQAINSDTCTNPFCPEGVHVRHLPRYSPRVLSTSRLHERHPTAAAMAHSSSMDTSAVLWNDAASDEDVLAFYSSKTITMNTTSERVPTVTASLSYTHTSRQANKELCCRAAETPQSSLCDLSLSEDMFSIGTTSSVGSAGCGGCSHRGNVIDVGALANFQRDGARRQRELFSVSNTKSGAH